MAMEQQLSQIDLQDRPSTSWGGMQPNQRPAASDELKRPHTSPSRGDMHMFRISRESAAFAASVYHAFFETPPQLPDVDAHIQREDLKLNKLKTANWSLRLPPSSKELSASGRVRPKTAGAKKTKRRADSEGKGVDLSASPSASVLDFKVKNQADDFSEPSKSGRKGWNALKKRLDDERQPTKDSSGVSEEDILVFIHYVDSMGNGDGAIDLMELKEAFKQLGRHRLSQARQANGRMQLRKLEVHARSRAVSLQSWFAEVEAQAAAARRPSALQRGGSTFGVTWEEPTSFQGMLTATVLQEALPKASQRRRPTLLGMRPQQMSTRHGPVKPSGAATGTAEDDGSGFTDGEVSALLQYVYPFDPAPSKLGLMDLLDALVRASEEEKEEDTTMQCQALRVLAQLEAYMASKNMRVNDLFFFLDTNHDGVVSREELAAGLDLLCRRDPRAEALRRHKTLKQKKAEEARRKLKSKVRAAQTHIDRMKVLGVYESLKKIEKLKRVTGLRLYDIFGRSGFDVSGDGSLDAMEVHGMLQSMRVDITLPQVKELVKHLDDDGNGTVEANEVERHLHRLKQDELLLQTYGHVLRDASVSSPGEELQRQVAQVVVQHRRRASQSKVLSMRDRLALQAQSVALAAPPRAPQPSGRRSTSNGGGSFYGPGTGRARPAALRLPPDLGGLPPRTPTARQNQPSIYKDLFHSTATLPSMKGGRLDMGSEPRLAERGNNNRRRAPLRPAPGSVLDDSWLHSFDTRLTREKSKMLCN